MIPEQDGRASTEYAQKRRGVVVDHEDRTQHSATLYYRTWLWSKAKGGIPKVARIVNENGVWRIDLRKSQELTSRIKLYKGRDVSGHYDGTEQWWK